MKLSDEKLIEFLWKSSLKSFPAILDALRYLDGKWVQQEAEYELLMRPWETTQLRPFKLESHRYVGFRPTHF